ncbi:MAG: hypothetical protein JWP29_5530 [Rhodoferax sp.]|nr:hypothetical protein [Rhodoferax sp.]
MSLKLLMRIVDHGCPFRTIDQTEIIHIDTLKAAGMVEADVPPAKSGVYSGEAVVHSITPVGLSIDQSMRRSGRIP